jgi:predicted ATPase
VNARLPIALTSFVGRRDDIHAVRELLRERRLATLTGAGGSGKTRLAADVCAELDDYGPNDVCWVDLATVTDPEQVPQIVATLLNVLLDPGSDPLQALLRAMRAAPTVALPGHLRAPA